MTAGAAGVEAELSRLFGAAATLRRIREARAACRGGRRRRPDSASGAAALERDLARAVDAWRPAMAALGRDDPEAAAVARLRYLDGMPWKEVIAELGSSRTAVQRARRDAAAWFGAHPRVVGDALRRAGRGGG